ncbi:MAG: HAD family hydrolase [Ruminococcaceae bacterium]|nr:HAD family hydrolase [Oscillospiraceae bacterium]
MIDYILFDLDGTLTDPGEGITNSVAYALCKYGISVTDKKSLECFIGPPLHESFQKYYNFSTLQSFDAVTKYREYYHDRGIFENMVYDGIDALLSDLKKEGKTLIMATSKPTVFAKRIAKHYGFAKYFDLILGSELNGTRVHKDSVIEEALRLAGDPPPERCIMIGDRDCDILGAHKNSIPAIGVLYGYGSLDELSLSGADMIAATVADLRRCLWDSFDESR